QEEHLLKQLAGDTSPSNDFPVVPSTAKTTKDSVTKLRKQLLETSALANAIEGELVIIREGGSTYDSLISLQPELAGLGLGVRWSWNGKTAQVQLTRQKGASLDSEKALARWTWSVLGEGERKQRYHQARRTTRQDDSARRQTAATAAGDRAAKLLLGQLQVTLNRLGASTRLNLPGLTSGTTYFNLDPRRVPTSIQALQAGVRLNMRIATPKSEPRRATEQHLFKIREEDDRYGDIEVEVRTMDTTWTEVYHGARKFIELSNTAKAALWEPLREAQSLLLEPSASRHCCPYRCAAMALRPATK
ncbi:hypothetical protein OC834_007516, partial [Tilletia horrida]